MEGLGILYSPIAKDCILHWAFLSDVMKTFVTRPQAHNPRELPGQIMMTSRDLNPNDDLCLKLSLIR